MTNKISDSVRIWMGFGFTFREAKILECETQRAIPTDEEAFEMIASFKQDANESYDKMLDDC